MHNLTFLRCKDCETFQYPSREVCRQCLSDQFTSSPVSERGLVLAVAKVHHSLEDRCRQYLPFSIGRIVLNHEICVMAYLPPDIEAGDKVFVSQVDGPIDAVVFAATREDDYEQAAALKTNNEPWKTRGKNEQ